MTWALCTDVRCRFLDEEDADFAAIFSLSDYHLQLLNATLDMRDNNWSIRQAAGNSMCSKSSLHRFIHTELPYLSTALYDSIINILKRHRRRK